MENIRIKTANVQLFRPKILSNSQKMGLMQARKTVRIKKSQSKSYSEATISKKRKRNQNIHKMIREIRDNQRGYIGHAIPKSHFVKLVKSITLEYGLQYRFQSLALDILAEAAEQFLVQILADCVLLAEHAKRITIFDRDLVLLIRLQRPNWAMKL